MFSHQEADMSKIEDLYVLYHDYVLYHKNIQNKET